MEKYRLPPDMCRLIKAMRENWEIAVQSGEPSVKALKQIIELCSSANNLRTEFLLFKGLLTDQRELNKRIRKMLRKIDEYLEIKGLENV